VFVGGRRVGSRGSWIMERDVKPEEMCWEEEEGQLERARRVESKYAPLRNW